MESCDRGCLASFAECTLSWCVVAGIRAWFSEWLHSCQWDSTTLLCLSIHFSAGMHKFLPFGFPEWHCCERLYTLFNFFMQHGFSLLRHTACECFFYSVRWPFPFLTSVLRFTNFKNFNKVVLFSFVVYSWEFLLPNTRSGRSTSAFSFKSFIDLAVVIRPLIYLELYVVTVKIQPPLFTCGVQFSQGHLLKGQIFSGRVPPTSWWKSIDCRSTGLSLDLKDSSSLSHMPIFRPAPYYFG